MHSYWKMIGGRCIYQSPSGAKVYQNLRYRWLTFNSLAIQTLIHRRHPERAELRYIKQLSIAIRSQPADCCLLGLGGAGVAHLITPYLGSSKILAVESSAAVIDIANTYFMTDRLNNLSIIHQNAELFVQQCNTRFQHIMVDLFDSNSFPTQCNTDDFFQNCRRLLLPDGILALNIANLDEQWPVFQRINSHFHQRTVSLPVKGLSNMIVLACNSSSINPLLDLLKTNSCLKKLSWDPRWGCIADIS